MTAPGSELRVCMLAAEVFPYAKAGGLADAVAGLAAALGREGVDVRVLSPHYPRLMAETPVEELLCLPWDESPGREPVRLLRDASQDSPRNLFLSAPRYFDRPAIYSDPATGEEYPDSFERFRCLSRAALALLPRLGWQPQVLHCHDFHAALAPVYLRLEPWKRHPFFREMVTLLTIHNVAYQGRYPGALLQGTDLPPELAAPLGPLEYGGEVNLLKGGICSADFLSTVSPRYAREIQSPEQGCGLDGVLRHRGAELVGILNGIDIDIWNPASDPALFAPFDAGHPEGKRINRAELGRRLGLPARSCPLVGMVSRLVPQKGVDLLLQAAPRLLELDCQWVILGSGLPRYEGALMELARGAPDRVAVQIGFDETLAHRIEAAADIFLMPSRYEPCGLNQMYSLRYGAIPVVHDTGGLADTVAEFDPGGLEGNGFKFRPFGVEALLEAMGKALGVWAQKEKWRALVGNAMAEDHSWEKAASRYLALYRRILEHD